MSLRKTKMRKGKERTLGAKLPQRRKVAATIAVVTLVSSFTTTVGKLHTFSDPKLKLYGGDETENITTYAQAKAFCAEQGRVLASQNEWCYEWWKDPVPPENLYDGLKDTEQWVPIRGGGNRNHYLQIGHWKNGTNNASSGACKTYKDLYNIPELETQAEIAPDATVEYCSRPTNCTENTCLFTCPHAEGYYPDPTDCRAYCRCSGDSRPSYWERVGGDGLIWDPYCGDSSPLDEEDKPLGVCSLQLTQCIVVVPLILFS